MLPRLACKFGSPPQAWGKRPCGTRPSGLAAGSPPQAWGKRRGRKIGGLPQGGSPPQAWGKPQLTLGAPTLYRFTPTGVGKADLDVFACIQWSVHPHRRGESEIQKGISPIFRRFTPTGVGKAIEGFAQESGDRGSPPQAWGKPSFAWVISSEPDGSPPQAWGKLVL